MLLPASMRIRNIFGTRFSGTLGKELVASSWKGKDYVRAYVVPEDPKTPRQLEHRQIWREAVAAWHALSETERAEYDREAEGMTGFNVFVGRYVRGRRAGTIPPASPPRARKAPEKKPPTTGTPSRKPRPTPSGSRSAGSGRRS